MNSTRPVVAGPAGTLLGSVTAGTDATAALKVAAVLFVTALTVLAAQVSVPLPFTPVPFTLQPMVVLLGGAALGSRLGLASQVLYLTLGIAGLPVFAASGLLPPGAGRLLGPTAGFLVSYPLAAWVTGALAERGFDRRYLTSLAAMAVGLCIIHSFGVAWLAFGASAAGLSLAFQTAVVPFFAADVLKLALAAGVLPGLWKFLGRPKSGRAAW